VRSSLRDRGHSWWRLRRTSSPGVKVLCCSTRSTVFLEANLRHPWAEDAAVSGEAMQQCNSATVQHQLPLAGGREAVAWAASHSWQVSNIVDKVARNTGTHL
jgi:hypothetical protein